MKFFLSLMSLFVVARALGSGHLSSDWTKAPSDPNSFHALRKPEGMPSDSPKAFSASFNNFMSEEDLSSLPFNDLVTFYREWLGSLEGRAGLQKNPSKLFLGIQSLYYLNEKSSQLKASEESGPEEKTSENEEKRKAILRRLINAFNDRLVMSNFPNDNRSLKELYEKYEGPQISSYFLGNRIILDFFKVPGKELQEILRDYFQYFSESPEKRKEREKRKKEEKEQKRFSIVIKIKNKEMKMSVEKILGQYIQCLNLYMKWESLEEFQEEYEEYKIFLELNQEKLIDFLDQIEFNEDIYKSFLINFSQNNKILPSKKDVFYYKNEDECNNHLNQILNQLEDILRLERDRLELDKVSQLLQALDRGINFLETLPQAKNEKKTKKLQELQKASQTHKDLYSSKVLGELSTLLNIFESLSPEELIENSDNCILFARNLPAFKRFCKSHQINLDWEELEDRKNKLLKSQLGFIQNPPPESLLMRPDSKAPQEIQEVFKKQNAIHLSLNKHLKPGQRMGSMGGSFISKTEKEIGSIGTAIESLLEKESFYDYSPLLFDNQGRISNQLEVLKGMFGPNIQALQDSQTNSVPGKGKKQKNSRRLDTLDLNG